MWIAITTAARELAPATDVLVEVALPLPLFTTFSYRADGALANALVPGTRVELMGVSPLGDALELELRGARFRIRTMDALALEVEV